MSYIDDYCNGFDGRWICRYCREQCRGDTGPTGIQGIQGTSCYAARLEQSLTNRKNKKAG